MVVISCGAGTMVGVGTMLGSEAVSETVGTVTVVGCNWSTSRDSFLSLVWAAAQREASSAKMASTKTLLTMLLATPASLREAWWFW